MNFYFITTSNMGPVRIIDKMIQEYVGNCFPKDAFKDRCEE